MFKNAQSAKYVSNPAEFFEDEPTVLSKTPHDQQERTKLLISTRHAWHRLRPPHRFGGASHAVSRKYVFS